LQHRDFLLLWSGQGVSLIGTQIQRAAVAWHLYLLTKSPWSLGLLGLFKMLPVVLFALGGGVVADAFDRRRLMLATQTVLALSSTALAVLTFSGRITPELIYGITFLSSTASAFDGPARQAMLPNLVPRDDLTNALSLNAISWQLASVMGPGLAGILLAARGPGLAYALDAFSFLGVIASLIALQHRDDPEGRSGEVSVAAAVDGLRFVAKQPVIRGMMLVDFLGTFFADATLLLPIFAVEILHVGPRGFGALAAARSLGAVIAAAGLTWLPPIKERGQVVLVCIALYGIAIAGFGASRVFWLSFTLLAVSGAADTVSMVIRQTVRQLLTPDEMRGRMTAVNMIFFVGGPQLGEVEAGALAKAVGAGWSVVLGGLACIVVAGVVALTMPSVRDHRAD
jgi:MFS family permease